MVKRNESKLGSGAAVAVGETLRAYASDELALAIGCLAWRGARLHAGIHQARKSMRRTRAALALGTPALGQGAWLIDRELRRITRSLSSVRDAQALVEALHRLATTHTKPATGLLLRRAHRAAARQRVVRVRAVLRDDPDFLPGHRAVLILLAAGLRTLPWPAVGEEEMLAALRHSASQAKAAGKRARSSGREEDWHRWRRRARRLSQQHRALGDPAGQSQATDKALALLLGEAQDYALLTAHCGRNSPFTDADRKVLEALAQKGLRRTQARIGKIAGKRDR